MVNGRCAACKYLRKRCPSDCIFSPYFPPNNPQRFAFVHRIYGASNIAKMLEQLPANARAKAADSLYYSARCRIEDPVYGIVGIISQLQQQIQNAESQLAQINAQIAICSANISSANNGLQQQQLPQFQQIEAEPNNNGLWVDQGSTGQSLFDPWGQAPSFM